MGGRRVIVPAQPWSEPLKATDYGLSAQRWYAQHLADALYRRKLTPLRFRLDGERPNFSTRGAGQLPSPAIFHTTAPALPKAGVHPASIKLGATDYQAALGEMTESQLEQWWAWSKAERDLHGRVMPRGAIFQARGAFVSPAPCHPDLQGAVLLIAGWASVTARVFAWGFDGESD